VRTYGEVVVCVCVCEADLTNGTMACVNVQAMAMRVATTSKLSGVSLARKARSGVSSTFSLRRGGGGAGATVPVRSVASSEVKTTESSAEESTSAGGTTITVEEQRRVAKAMTQYFEDVEYEKQVEEGIGLGWTEDNEIINGRWAMMGFAIGLLTEYATGASFPDQVAITLSNLGVLDTGY